MKNIVKVLLRKCYKPIASAFRPRAKKRQPRRIGAACHMRKFTATIAIHFRDDCCSVMVPGNYFITIRNFFFQSFTEIPDRYLIGMRAKIKTMLLWDNYVVRMGEFMKPGNTETLFDNLTELLWCGRGPTINVV